MRASINGVETLHLNIPKQLWRHKRLPMAISTAYADPAHHSMHSKSAF
jgi:hypothetical protein